MGNHKGSPLRNLLLYITAFTLAAMNTSCKDDEKTADPDPRIRRVLIPQLGNVNFIVNDFEGKIYNYDSLAYGTRVDSLYPTFYSYSTGSANNLTFQYSYDGVNFIDFRNTVAINFTNPVKFVSTNTEDNSKKEYMLDVRVHRYDVEAFQWTNISTVAELGETILSQKSIVYNDVMMQFIQTATDLKVLSSVDGKQWSSKLITEPEVLELSTLCTVDDSIFVQGKSGAIYAANFNGFQFNKFDAITSGQLLYTLNKQIWVLDGSNIKSYSKSGEAKVSQPMPEKFVVDTITPFTAPSGNTILGYLYAKKGDNAEIWGADRYGNIECLTDASFGLPYMDKAITFRFGNNLSIIGGIAADGTYSTKCYTSDNSGLSWTTDEHKDLGSTVGSLSDAGLFQIGNKGEFILIGGKTANGQSNNVWALRLKKLLLEESFLNKIK